MVVTEPSGWNCCANGQIMAIFQFGRVLNRADYIPDAGKITSEQIWRNILIQRPSKKRSKSASL
jgi:hypothetical protein